MESQIWDFETESLGSKSSFGSKSCPRLWHRCIKLSLISFCWFHCDSGGCDGLIPRSEHALALLLCIIQLIPRTKYALASMHYTADTQKSAWCHALCFASWHWCLAYFTLYIALQSFELDYIATIFVSEIDIVENVFLCLLFKWRKPWRKPLLDRSGKVVICPLQAGAWCHDLQVSQIPLKRKRRQEQIGLSGQKGGRGGMISANVS